MPITQVVLLDNSEQVAHKLNQRDDHRLTDIICVGPAQTPLAAGGGGGFHPLLSCFNFLYNKINTNL